ncbi:HlyD family secretion protein [Geminicoccus flavidas]|uniref:hypothetical protein n=1 Tax=Geminicoccus flavidas TaxID=2506407 RepID=UPI001359E002|nr:hypothetical protein [Geminicoccus flavidas]
MAGEAAAERPGGRWSRWLWRLGLLLLLGYIAWILTPYLRSVIVRDAAVTARIHVATAPLRGTIHDLAVSIGERAGADRLIATIRNPVADRSALAQAEARVAVAEANVADLQAELDELRRLDAELQDRFTRHAELFTRDLESIVEGARAELTLIGQRLALVRSMTERKEALGRTGTASQSAIDEARLQLLELELLQAEQETVVARAELRLRAIADGMPLLENGNDPDWGLRSRTTLRLELARLAGGLADATASLAEARAVAAAARETFDQVSTGTVTAPPGAMIWSVVTGSGTTVEVGAPVAKWLDCSVLLIDVPVSDVEAALLRPSMPAEVILEGERRVRHARVLLTRGAAATIGEADLAAIAKGRGSGIGQAILTLEQTEADTAACPVGQAAHVDFPEIGLIDILRARLGI